MSLVFLNTFSMNMLGKREAAIQYQPVSLNRLAKLIEGTNGENVSHISQAQICIILTDKLEGVCPDLRGKLWIKPSKAPYYINPEDTIIQIQYIGPFIEGHSMPKHGSFLYWEITPMIKMSSFQDKDGNTYTTYQH